MFSLNTTLLREKFIIRENSATKAAPLIALGNRIALPLITHNGEYDETLVVRGHNMHITLRMAALLCSTFYNAGPILPRNPAFNFAHAWAEALPLFEKQHNKDSWIAVYHAGKCVFSSGKYHPFFDIIEQCDARNRDEYDRAVTIAEDAFKQSGRAVTIDHHTNIAAVIGATPQKIRLGLIVRKPGNAATFNFTLDGTQKDITYQPTDIGITLNHAASWLELIQLSITAGFYQSKRGDAIARAAPLPAVQSRLGTLNADIARYEGIFTPAYRPDRPDMMGLIEATAFYARHGK